MTEERLNTAKDIYRDLCFWQSRQKEMEYVKAQLNVARVEISLYGGSSLCVPTEMQEELLVYVVNRIEEEARQQIEILQKKFDEI